MANLFLAIGMLIQQTDPLLARSTGTALTKALLHPKILEKQMLTNDLLDKLETIYSNTLQELKRIDQAWISTENARPGPSVVSALLSRFAHLTRWIGELNELEFKLSTFSPP